jgi:hypothetical protein
MQGDKDIKCPEDPSNIPSSNNHSPKDARNAMGKDMARHETRYSHAFDQDKNEHIHSNQKQL